MQSQYRINILWSNEDNCYLVELPEFTHKLPRYITHGDTYDEALANAQEVLAMLTQEYQEKGKPVPEPQVLQAA